MKPLRYEKSGQHYPSKAGRHCPAEQAQVANVGGNTPSAVAVSRRTYMRRWRVRSSAVEAADPEKRPQVEERPTPPLKRKPPPGGERKARWAARRGDEDTRRGHAQASRAR